MPRSTLLTYRIVDRNDAMCDEDFNWPLQEYSPHNKKYVCEGCGAFHDRLLRLHFDYSNDYGWNTNGPNFEHWDEFNEQYPQWKHITYSIWLDFELWNGDIKVAHFWLHNNKIKIEHPQLKLWHRYDRIITEDLNRNMKTLNRIVCSVIEKYEYGEQIPDRIETEYAVRNLMRS